jgi:GxxExxY protein
LYRDEEDDVSLAEAQRRRDFYNDVIVSFADIEETSMHENEVGTACVSAAISVHRELGPGLLESVYELTLLHELTSRGLSVTRQVPISIRYKELVVPDAFRADLIVENRVILELKSVEELNNAHRKQLLTYLRLSGLKLGYLFNFGAELMRHGIVRTVNGLDEPRKG